jgi:CO/xanthine dehydrogenase Mo-binding subunit
MYTSVNKSPRRVDAYEKVTGKAKFCADLDFGGQLYAQTVYSLHAHAKIVDIDTSEAEKLDGVVDIITAKDVPGTNSMFGRFPVLADREVKYVGDGVAVVAAETKEIARHAAHLIQAKYEELPGVYSIEEAMEEGALLVHEDEEGNRMENTHYVMRAGDVKKGFGEADVILERTYNTHFVDQVYIEPEAVIALPDPYRKGIIIHGCIQNPYSIRQNVAAVMNMKMSDVRVISSTIGGSFGGKDESVMSMGARASILALRTGRPIKMVLAREESVLESCKRHAYKCIYKLGAKKDGTITAVEDEIITQGGAYNNKAMFANWRASVHAAGTYYIPNVKTDVYGVYTNTTYGGAYRGFSAPQVVFANETLIDELAEELNMSPKEIRIKNCFKPGDELPTGQVLEPGKISAPLKEMIEDVCSRVEFGDKWERYKKENAVAGAVKRGIGLSCTFRGTGLGGEGIDTAGATVTIEKDGSVTIVSDLTEMGQGMRTAHAQIVAEVLGISIDRISFINTDTSISMDGGPTVASRGLLAGGNAMKIAAETLRERLDHTAAGILGCSPDDIMRGNEIIHLKHDKGKMVTFDDILPVCFAEHGISLSAQGWYNPGPEELSHETGRGNAYPSYIYGCAAAEILVNTDTGKVDVEKMTAAYEVGRAINPEIVKSQLYGGLLQGLGYGIFEELGEDKGKMKNLNYDGYLIPTIEDAPEFEIILYETDENVGPFGAKGVGEIGIELAAPAINNAVYHATGKRLRDLPLNLERVKLGKALTLSGGMDKC